MNKNIYISGIFIACFKYKDNLHYCMLLVSDIDFNQLIFFHSTFMADCFCHNPYVRYIYITINM